MPLYDIDKTHNTLLYNGEIYSIKKNLISLIPIRLKNIGIENFNVYNNDTIQLFDILNKYSEFYYNEKNINEILNYEEDMLKIIDCFHGDFAFIYQDRLNNLIIIGKDIYGKKSLLLGFHEHGFCITSCIPHIDKNKLIPEEPGEENNEQEEDNGKVDKEFLQKKYMSEYISSKNKEWLEIPPFSLTFIKIHSLEDSLNLTFTNNKFPSSYIFAVPHLLMEENKAELDDADVVVTKVLMKSVKRILKNIIEYKQYFMKLKNHNEIIDKSFDIIIKNKENINKTSSKIAVMFSGGLDSTLIAHIVNLIIPIHEKS